jgi:DNA polymerase-3 subunit delta'
MHPELEKRLSLGTLPSTLLFTGPKENVNLSLAKELAKALFGFSHGPKIDSGSHPDLHFYTPDPKSDLHLVQEMRALIDETALPPFEAKRKLFVIDEAEKMLPSSSQALLKTLEEPPADTVIVLLTRDPALLLPTIYSRCARFSFEAAEGREIAPLLAELLGLALARDEVALLEALDGQIEELNALEMETILHSLFLLGCRKRPFQKVARLIEEAQGASQLHMKRRNIILNFLFSLQ